MRRTRVRRIVIANAIVLAASLLIWTGIALSPNQPNEARMYYAIYVEDANGVVWPAQAEVFFAIEKPLHPPWTPCPADATYVYCPCLFIKQGGFLFMFGNIVLNKPTSIGKFR